MFRLGRITDYSSGRSYFNTDVMINKGGFNLLCFVKVIVFFFVLLKSVQNKVYSIQRVLFCISFILDCFVKK